MAQNVLIEVLTETASPFDVHSSAVASETEAVRQTESVLSAFGLEGITVDMSVAPVPMLLRPVESVGRSANVFSTLQSMGLRAQEGFSPPEFNGRSVVIAASVEDGRIEALQSRPDVIVWPNSEITLLNQSTSAAVDCRPFQAGVDIATIRKTLGVDAAWGGGFRGKGIVVGIIDQGVNGATYPIRGGFSRPGSPPPGTAPVTSHGSMCAADVLIAAPEATLYDYPFLGIPTSGGALQMFQAVLDQRRRDGTPHITNNSYGFVGIPDPVTNPRHEVHDINHPLHRKVREVVTAGVACFFAAGNCGQDCPSGNCHPSGIGPGRSIHASNSLIEVITVAAVNNARNRIGYSSQGPGLFEKNKPDIASYSHIFGNFGPGRPGGTHSPFDSGTSAATPVAAGVGAMLLSAVPTLLPAQLKDLLIKTAMAQGGGGWNADFGNGIIDAKAAYVALTGGASLPTSQMPPPPPPQPPQPSV